MQISRCILLACVTTYLSSSLLSAQEPTERSKEEQAKALQALDQKLKELDTKSQTVTPAKPAPPPKPAAPAPTKPKPAAAPTTTTTVTQPKPAAAPTAAPSKPATAPAAATVAAPKPTAAPPPTQPKPSTPVPGKVVVESTGAVTVVPTAASGPKYMELTPAPNPAETRKAEQALQDKMNALNAGSAPTAAAAKGAPTRPGVTAQQPAYAPAVVSPPPASMASEKPVKSAPSGTFAPLPPPASTLTASQDQRLQELLQQYKANQITPEQYHAQRKKILAAP